MSLNNVKSVMVHVCWLWLSVEHWRRRWLVEAKQPQCTRAVDDAAPVTSTSTVLETCCHTPSVTLWRRRRPVKSVQYLHYSSATPSQTSPTHAHIRSRLPAWYQPQTRVCLRSVKPRLHQIHVAGYKYPGPGRVTCIRIGLQVDTTCIRATCIWCKHLHVISSL